MLKIGQRLVIFEATIYQILGVAHKIAAVNALQRMDALILHGLAITAELVG